jgi:hypothetical protein
VRSTSATGRTCPNVWRPLSHGGTSVLGGTQQQVEPAISFRPRADIQGVEQFLGMQRTRVWLDTADSTGRIRIRTMVRCFCSTRVGIGSSPAEVNQLAARRGINQTMRRLSGS